MAKGTLQNCSYDTVRRLQDDVETVKKEVSGLSATGGVLEHRLDNMEASLSRAEEKIEKMMEKPAKRWDFILSEILKLLVAGIVGYVMVKLGL